MAGNLIIFWSLPLSTLFCLGCHSAGGLVEVIIFWFPIVCVGALYVWELCERRRSQKLRCAVEAKRTAAEAKRTTAEEKRTEVAEDPTALATVQALIEVATPDLDERATQAASTQVRLKEKARVAEMASEAEAAEPRSLEMFQKLAAEAEAAAAEASAAQHSRSASEVEAYVRP